MVLVWLVGLLCVGGRWWVSGGGGRVKSIRVSVRRACCGCCGGVVDYSAVDYMIIYIHTHRYTHLQQHMPPEFLVPHGAAQVDQGLRTRLADAVDVVLGQADVRGQEALGGVLLWWIDVCVYLLGGC